MTMRLLKITILTMVLLATSCSSNSIPHFNGLPKFGANTSKPAEVPTPRLVMFIGVDISGSFMNGRYFDDSIQFLARYIYGHLNGVGNMEVPHSLFVGSIGGFKKDEPKTLYPIESFQNRSVEDIEARLHEIFPKGRVNHFTDFNAFFTQVGDMIDQKKLLLKPISIVLMTDGDPDLGEGTAAASASNAEREAKFRSLSVAPLEGLSRNITVRVLYTDAVTGKDWLDDMPRKRVKVWTQDAIVMKEWKDPTIYLPDTPFEKQTRFFSWVQDNVDFQPRLRRVD
jgi:hypothetical protein